MPDISRLWLSLFIWASSADGIDLDKLSNKAEMNLMNLFDVLFGSPLNEIPPPPIDPRTGKRPKYVIVIDAIDECGAARDENYVREEHAGDEAERRTATGAPESSGKMSESMIAKSLRYPSPL